MIILLRSMKRWWKNLTRTYDESEFPKSQSEHGEETLTKYEKINLLIEYADEIGISKSDILQKLLEDRKRSRGCRRSGASELMEVRSRENRRNVMQYWKK